MNWCRGGSAPVPPYPVPIDRYTERLAGTDLSRVLYVVDVAAGLLQGQRWHVVGDADALAQGSEGGVLEQFAQFGLPGEDEGDDHICRWRHIANLENAIRICYNA